MKSLCSGRVAGGGGAICNCIFSLPSLLSSLCVILSHFFRQHFVLLWIEFEFNFKPNRVSPIPFGIVISHVFIWICCDHFRFQQVNRNDLHQQIHVADISMLFFFLDTWNFECVHHFVYIEYQINPTDYPHFFASGEWFDEIQVSLNKREKKRSALNFQV